MKGFARWEQWSEAVHLQRVCGNPRNPVAATPSEEQTNNIVKDVGELLGMDITENDIAVRHRMPQSQKHKGKPGPPAIIVKFARRDFKENFYHAGKQLKLYLAESLT